jgi:hypothetical protein
MQIDLFAGNKVLRSLWNSHWGSANRLETTAPRRGVLQNLRHKLSGRNKILWPLRKIH